MEDSNHKLRGFLLDFDNFFLKDYFFELYNIRSGDSYQYLSAISTCTMSIDPYSLGVLKDKFYLKYRLK